MWCRKAWSNEAAAVIEGHQKNRVMRGEGEEISGEARVRKRLKYLGWAEFERQQLEKRSRSTLLASASKCE